MLAIGVETLAMDCLFRDVTKQCGGITNEHLLQRCIGGTWESDDVICANCNEYFSQDVDSRLCKNFEWLMCVLSPLLSGNLKNKIIKLNSSDGVPVQVTSGGMVSIAKTKTIQSKDGPHIISHSEIQAKLAAQAQKWPDGQYECRKLPTSHLVRLPPQQSIYDLGFYRAVMKCLIQVLDKASRRDKSMSLARRSELQSIRRFIRHGTIGGPISWNFLPIFRLEGDLQRLFSSDFEFANRAAIFFDKRKGKLFGLLQIANTIPLGGYLSTGLDWEEESFSFLYEKNLIPRQENNAIEKWLPFCAMDERKFNFYQFAISSKESADFAWYSFRRSVSEQIGRAYAVVEMNSDRGLIETMIVQYEHLINDQSLSPGDAATSLVEVILRQRYQSRGIPEERWSILRYEVRIMLQLNSIRVFEQFKKTNEFGETACELLVAYRSQLKKLIDEFGFPVGSSPVS